MALVLLFGLFITLVGGLGVVAPDALLGIARYSATPAGLYLAAAFRIVVGVLLVRIASRSRAPGLIRGLGFFLIVVGVFTAILGVDRARAVLDWWAGLGAVGMRLLPALAFLFGITVVWAVRPRRR